jgi:multiple sugar transport system permease protein
VRVAWVLPAVALAVCVVLGPFAASAAAGVPLLGEALGDASFGRAALVTLAFALVSVTLEFLLGLLIALLLDATLRMRGTLRAAALVPWALPTAVMAMSWRWIFNDTYGVANDLPLRLGLIDQAIPWLARPGAAFVTLVVADVWKTTPFVAIILLAGLQTIPRDLHEAMSLDGAGPVRRFLHITLPLLRPTLAVAVTFRLIQALGLFDLVHVLTGGGPGSSTQTVALYVYKVLIEFHRRDYGASLTLATVVAVFAIAAATAALIRGRVRA